MKKNPTWKEWGVSSFSKLQTCIQINKNTKVKKKHFIFIIQNNNKNRKHIKIKNKKDNFFIKKLKHEPNIVEITHLCIRHRVQTSDSIFLLLRLLFSSLEKDGDTVFQRRIGFVTTSLNSIESKTFFFFNSSGE